eukprot:sb/3468996/
MTTSGYHHHHTIGPDNLFTNIESLMNEVNSPHRLNINSVQSLKDLHNSAAGTLEHGHGSPVPPGGGGGVPYGYTEHYMGFGEIPTFPFATTVEGGEWPFRRLEGQRLLAAVLLIQYVLGTCPISKSAVPESNAEFTGTTWADSNNLALADDTQFVLKCAQANHVFVNSVRAVDNVNITSLDSSGQNSNIVNHLFTMTLDRLQLGPLPLGVPKAKGHLRFKVSVENSRGLDLRFSHDYLYFPP